MSKSTKNTHKIDYALLVTVVALLTIGLMMIYSTTFALGYSLHSQSAYYLLRQLVWMGLGEWWCLFNLAEDDLVLNQMIRVDKAYVSSEIYSLKQT